MTVYRRAFAPHDITRIRWVSDARIAPDGERVAYVVTTLDEARDEYLSQIWITGLPRPFTTGPLRDTAPRWSPDGRWLAFLSERDGAKKAQLYVMPATGGEATRLTDLPHGVTDPVWSPDSTRLAFVARVGGGPEPESAEDKRTSKPARVITSLKYRLNGEGFVYDRRPHVFVVSLDAGPAVQITAGDFVHEHPAWSPDGEWLAFTSARHDDRDNDDVADLWIAPAKGGTARPLTSATGPVAMPAWSPDGRAIAYVGRAAPNFFGGNLRLFTVPVAGGPSRCLSAAFDRSVSLTARPHWHPDGTIVFAIEDRGDVPLYAVASDGGSEPRRLIGGARSLTSFSVARNGRVAFTANDVTTPDEVFVARADGGDERRLTDVNADWRAEVHTAPAERFTVERAGHTIDVWVMRPFSFESGRKYPALVNVHGGPHAQYGHCFFDEFQVYAAAGYVVVFPNPRGSQGYGEAFTRAVVGDWGGGDYADVMTAVDEALRRCDFIDRARLGLMGGSYGGFLTTWTVAHTTRFRAACSERAVNNQLTMFGTSDIGHIFQVVEGGGGALPWHDPARWIERSPLTYAKDIRTPLLIVHSENDLRCPIAEAEQLFVALKKLGRDVTFVRFPDETHELTRSGKPRHRLERFRIILDWFAKHLG